MGRLVQACRRQWVAILCSVIITLAVVAVVIGGEAALSTTTFCTSCHSMSYPADELRESDHYSALGIDPGCKDCHIPQGVANFHLAVQTHILDGVRELWLEMTGDYSSEQQFNERRQEMAHHARMNLKRWDSVTCRDCHRDPRPSGEAEEEHQKMLTEGATCIDCHQNLVHEEVDETDLDASLAQGKMVIRSEDD